MSLPRPASQVKDSAPYQHVSRRRVGVLMVNLGTPDSPTAAGLRPYLKEFLSDPRVVEIPKLAWWPILNLIILNTRPKKSAEKYASVWMEEGSPLRVYSERQLAGVEKALQAEGYDVVMGLAMRYGEPSIANAMARMTSLGVDRLLVLPLYPQYSASTTATVFDRVYDVLSTMRNPPGLRTIRNYHDHPTYIQAVADSIQRFRAQHGSGQHLLFSFHGVPKRTLLKGDPYHCECQKTARLVAQRLGLPADAYSVTFQSRFGPAEWLKPYTSERLKALPGEGVKRLDVVCPGFIADCLETLEEIAMEGKEDFLHAGGEQYHYIPCLNESPDAIRLLTELVKQETAGWPTGKDTPEAQQDRAVATASYERMAPLIKG